jgi:hypothetical protein
MMEFVSWDGEIPNIFGKTKAMFQTTKQVWSFQYLEIEQTVDLWISDHLVIMAPSPTPHSLKLSQDFPGELVSWYPLVNCPITMENHNF